MSKFVEYCGAATSFTLYPKDVCGFTSIILVFSIFFRYFLQAEDELDCNWLFMKGQEDDDAAWFTWLSKQM